MYATHIFDGLDDWPTHLAYLADGRLTRFGALADFPEFAARRAAGSAAPLLRTIEAWMRADREAKRAAGRKVAEAAAGDGVVDELRGQAGNGYLPGWFNMGFG